MIDRDASNAKRHPSREFVLSCSDGGWRQSGGILVAFDPQSSGQAGGHRSSPLILPLYRSLQDKEAVEKVQAEREIPDLRPGYIVQLKVEVPESKRRVSVLKGIVISRRNAGLNTTFGLRRLVAGVGVESVFPLYSPNIKEMKVLDKKKVGRAKLYYLGDRMNPHKK